MHIARLNKLLRKWSVLSKFICIIAPWEYLQKFNLHGFITDLPRYTHFKMVMAAWREP